MARWPIVIALAVIGVFAVWRFEPFLTQPREVIASTPSPPPIYGEAPATLPGHGTACLDQIPYDKNSQVLQLVITKAPKDSPALDVAMSAKGWNDYARVPGGYGQGPVEVAVSPPRDAVLGTLCVSNTGSKPVLLQGSTEGRTQSRPNLTVNGAPVGIRVTTKFHERTPSSLVSRTPAIVGHAATFKPLPLWMIWPLALIALLGIPALTLVAFRSAVGVGNAAAADPAATAPPVPFPWIGRGVRWARPHVRRLYTFAASIPAPWAAGALLVLVAAYLFSHAIHAHGFQLDEDMYVYIARFTKEHFPDALWNTTVVTRGLQRLESWMLILPLSLFKGSVAFPIGHAINVLAFTSAGIPAYLIARGFGLGGIWRLLAVFLTLVMPWAVVATTFLSEPLGYPAFCWCLWAIWRAAWEPHARRDILALALILVACFARSSMVVLFPLLYVVLAAQVLRYGPRGRRAVLALQWPLLAFAVLALVVYVLSRNGVLTQVHSLTAYYGANPQPISAAFLHKNWIYVAKTAVGTGFIPLFVGGAWLFVRAFRPRDAITHALALAGLGSILVVLYSNATAGTDERYIIYLAFPLALATVLAFARREVPWPLVVIGGLLVTHLIWTHAWNPDTGPFGYFVAPAETFYARSILLRLTVEHPGSDPRVYALAVELAIVAACAFAMTRHRLAPRAVAVVLAGLVVLQLGQTDYAVGRYIDQAAAGHGPGLKQRAWVDEQLYGKAKAGYWSVAAGNSGLYGPIAREVQFWNNSVTSVVIVDSELGTDVPPGDDFIVATMNHDTGEVTPVGPDRRPKPLPRYLVVPADGLSSVYGRLVTKSSYLPAALVEWKPPLRMRWTISGIEPDGWLRPDAATVRVFAAPLSPRTEQCASVDVRAPVGWKGGWELTSDHYRRRAQIQPQGFARVEVPLRAIAAGKPYQDVELAGRGKPVQLADGRITTVQLAAVDVKPCGA